MAHKLAADASSDLDDIWHYVATEGGSAARSDRFVASLTDRFFALARNPYIGRRRDDLRSDLRSFPVGQYVIFYRIRDEDVVILRVLRGSRDIDSLLRR
jgi:toxin ParE1/3/4